MRASWVGWVFAVTACSSFDSEPPAADAGSSDAASTDSGADAGAPVEGFESVPAACGEWRGIDATVTLVDGGVTGKACKVCSTKTEYFHLRRATPAVDRAAAGSTVFIEASVRLDAATDPKLMVAAAFLANGQTISRGTYATTASSDYQAISYVVSTSGGERLHPDFEGRAGKLGACFLIDDIRITTTP